jgi:hypothetical protein
MSNSLNKCRLVKGWIKPFLAAIEDGYNELNASQMAGISTVMVSQQVDQDPAFKKSYEDAHENRRERPGHGAW